MARLDLIPDEVKQQAVRDMARKRTREAQKAAGAEAPSLWTPYDEDGKRPKLFRKTRANVQLSKEEIRAIRKGRKALRKEMRARGLKSRRDFELTAGTLGLYFDSNRSFWAWLMSHWALALLGSLLALLSVLFLFAAVTYIRGFFTINLSDSMIRSGFILSEDAGFTNPTSRLFASPAEDVPCISIADIPAEIPETDGVYHSNSLFAYSFYIQNGGEDINGFNWSLRLNSESKKLSEAVWAIVFVDGKMRIYAKQNRLTGEAEALPALSDTRRGYLTLPLMELAPDSDQFQVVQTRGSHSYYRVVPDRFESEDVVVSGIQRNIVPQEIHKFTVILFLEGDDADATDELIGGHLGVEFKMESIDDEEEAGHGSQAKQSVFHSIKNYFSHLWSNLTSGQDEGAHREAE